MSVCLGATKQLRPIEAVAEAPKAQEAPAKRSGRPTKAELLAEAASLGIDVPSKATNAEIARLIEEAKG